MVRCYQRRNKRRLEAISSDDEPKLPFEVIIEILSWLPVVSLLRFKCVCKLWHSLIQEYNFIAKHMSRVMPMRIKYRLMKNESNLVSTYFHENYECVSFVAGLLLERHSTSGFYRIRNPATHQVLYLPQAHDKVARIGTAFNSLTGEIKLVSFYKDDDDDKDEVGFDVMNLCKDETWRTLKYPNQGLRKKQGKWALKSQLLLTDKEAARVCNYAEIITDGQDMYLEIKSLDLWSESFFTATLPRGAFSDLDKVRVINWNRRIAVVDVIGEAIHALVLEDYKEQRRSQKKIIVPLKCIMKEIPSLEGQTMIPLNVFCEKVMLSYSKGAETQVFDMKMRKVDRLQLRKFDVEHEGFHKPSLLSFKGMRLEFEDGTSSSARAKN